MIELTYQLRLDSPVHIGTGYGFAGFLDSVVVRDAAGIIYLPGSTIKGKTRATARRLANSLHLPICPPESPCGLLHAVPCAICRLFGSPHFAGQLYFDNIQLPDSYRELLTWLSEQDPLAARVAVTGRRTQVMLSRSRRSALPDHLFTHELVWENLPLAGHISGEVSGGSIATTADLALLWSALSLNTHLGRARSRGLGRCAVTVDSAMLHGVPFIDETYAAALHELEKGVA